MDSALLLKAHRKVFGFGNDSTSQRILTISWRATPYTLFCSGMQIGLSEIYMLKLYHLKIFIIKSLQLALPKTSHHYYLLL